MYKSVFVTLFRLVWSALNRCLLLLVIINDIACNVPMILSLRNFTVALPLTCLRPLQWALVLTLRLLMSHMYMEHLFLMFLDHTQRRSTVGRTPLDE